MTGQKLRTQWSKEPDEEPDYSDWKITLAIKKGDDPTDPATGLFTRSSQSKTDRKETISSSFSLSSSSVTFSVHRNILGPQSEYFNRIFKSNDGGFSEAHHRHSHIDFPSSISMKSFSLIVEAFEALLKYCYLENVDFKGTSPVPLLYFCDYFQMVDDFENKVEEFSMIRFMTSEHKLHLLYEQIIEFRTAGLNVERAQSLTAKSCYDTYGLLLEGTPMAKIADLPLWLDIVSIIQERGYYTIRNKKRCRTGNERKTVSKYWSMNIAFFLEKNNDNSLAVDATSFQKLTDEMILPDVDIVAALVLLKEEQKYVPSKVPISDYNKDDEQEESSLLTNLQNRCLESLVKTKLELDTNKKLRDRAMKVLILFPRVMGMYLNRTLNSYAEMTRKNYEDEAKRRKLEQDNTVRLKNVEQELETEKEKNMLLLAEKINNTTPQPNYHFSSNLFVQPQSYTQQRIQQPRAQRKKKKIGF